MNRITNHESRVTPHWTERYVGMPYVEGEFDCADLARLAQRERFGRELRLPASRDYAGKSGIAKVRAMRDQIERSKLDYAAPIPEPEEGCCALMISRGVLAHIGTWCEIGGEGWVLHCASNARQAVLHRVRDLPLQGLKIEGYYRWI